MPIFKAWLKELIIAFPGPLKDSKIMESGTVEIFNGKIVCPRCDGNGLVYKSKVVDLDLILYICDECEATWQDEEISISNFQNLTTFIEGKGLNIKDVQFIDLGYDWYN